MATVNPNMESQKRGCNGCIVLGVVGMFLFTMGFVMVFGFGTTLLAKIMDDDGSPLSSLTSAPVVVVPVEGAIMDSRPLTKLLSKIGETSSVQAVVLRIDSPGGSVGASEEIYRASQKLRDKGKIVVASFGNSAASGGYYIACAADAIVTNEGTITGSIGVVSDGVVFERLMDKLGIVQQSTASGPLKQVGTPMRPATEMEKNLLQSLVGDLYSQFFQVVLASRWKQMDAAVERDSNCYARIASLGLSAGTTESLVKYEYFSRGSIASAVGCSADTEARLLSVADGRVLTGRQAVALGLADGIGGLSDAITTAGRLTKLGDNPKYVERKPTNRLNEWLSTESKSFVEGLILSDSNSMKFMMPSFVRGE